MLNKGGLCLATYIDIIYLSLSLYQSVKLSIMSIYSFERMNFIIWHQLPNQRKAVSIAHFYCNSNVNTPIYTRQFKIIMITLPAAQTDATIFPRENQQFAHTYFSVKYQLV